MLILESIYVATMITSLLVAGYFGNWGYRLIKHRLESRKERKERPCLVTMLLPLVVGSCIASFSIFLESVLLLLSSFYDLDVYFNMSSSVDTIKQATGIKTHIFIILNMFLILANFLHMVSFWSISNSVKTASVRLMLLLGSIFLMLALLTGYDVLR